MRDSRGARYWVILAVVGLVGGALSGLFGIGGGIVMVPLLVTLAGFDQRQAAATSLVAIIPAAIVGSITYLVNEEIDVVAGAIISVGAVAGALIGSMLLRRLSLAWLSWMFIALLLVVAVRLLIVVPERGEALELSPGVALGYVALGLVMGIASGLFGIGGGVIAVPALVAIFGISDLIAKGTSLLVMIPTSIVGTISHVRARAVDVRAGLVVGVTATVASVPGALLALALPPRLSSILFAILLLVVAAQLIVRAIRTRGR
jgi:uncharacterized protein